MQNISQDIIIKAAQGDIDSFEEIYRNYVGFVYNVAYRILLDRQDTEEITQNVFLKVHRKLKKFRFKSSFSTWLYRVAVNEALNFAKKRTKEKNRMVVEYDDKILLKGTVNPMQKKIDKEYKQDIVEKLLRVLTVDQRACIVLRHIEGFSYKEIAENLHININTVRSRLKRARMKLLTLNKKGGR